MEISIGIKNTGTLKLASEFRQRAAYLQQLIPYLAARRVQQTIEENLPNEKSASALKSSMRVARVVGLDKSVFAYAAFSDVQDQAVTAIAAAETILYVKIKKLSIFVPESVRLLEEYGPWTTTTLPFMPDRRHALVISRHVPAKVVTQTERDREADRLVWAAKLQRAGVRKTMQIEKPAKSRAVPDSAFLSMRYEFGLGGLRPRPHWRPAILGFAHELPGLFANARVRGVLTDPDNATWRRPPKSDLTIASSRAKDFAGFQRALGIRIGT